MSDDAWRKRIETLMEERNISRTEMARRMGRNHTIMKAVLDENRIPRMDTAILIARALGVSLA
jgi:plasmid maintenance system antidote protein VapI